MASGTSPDASSMTPQGSAMNETMRLQLAYGAGMSNIRPVYSDTTMDIWELPDAASYYSVTGGPCNLSNQSFDSLDAECTSRATLLRRELYMEGWLARVNQSFAKVEAASGIFQSIELPEGRSTIRFKFSPPYVQYAWLLFWLGLLGLGWEMRKCFGSHVVTVPGNPPI
jgi:hypothetical protein